MTQEMKNKKLAIEGHTTRYKEVIELFEMLGGKMKGKIIGNGLFHVYYINSDGNIDYTHVSLLNDAMIFTLEEFLKKYPYKVGDKVQDKGSTSWDTIYVIEKMIWEDNQINYIVHNSLNEYPKYTVTAEGLQPYEEENYTEIYTDNAINDDSKTDIIINGENLIAPNGYTIENATRNNNRLIVEYIKNNLQYPKSYEGCRMILNQELEEQSTLGYKGADFYYFQLLIICRDAYWKIAGDWKPYWNNDTQFKFIITCRRDNIIKDTYTAKNCILAFPTEEMRDAFYENFKFLINKCKEFL